jgi:hypothetical protein
MRMTKILQYVLAAGLLAALAAQADTTTLRGPVLGYVVDGRAQTVRPINGIPGASHLGAPLELPFLVTQAVFSSAGDFGLMGGTEGEGLYLVGNLGATPAVSRITGAIRPDRMVLNGANTAVALYQAEPRQLQVVRGLPGNPVVGPVLDLASLSGTVRALALDTPGREALLAVADNGRGALVRISVPEEGERIEPRSLGVFGSPSAVTLLNRDRDAVLTDSDTNQLFLIRDFAGEAAIESLASERDGILNPVGVEVSLDGRRVFVANAGDRGSVLVVDLAARVVELRATPEGAPTRLERLQGRTAFLLNEPGEAPLQVLDNVENPEVYFVPAGRDN